MGSFAQSFLREPRRVNFVGASAALVGTLGQMLSLLFAEDLLLKWLRFAFIVVITVGFAFVTWAAVVNSSPWVLSGSPVVLCGLLLCCVGVGLVPPDPLLSALSSASLLLAGLALVIIGCALFIKQGVDDFRRPIMGPQNYFLFGAVLFGGGALVFLLCTIPQLRPSWRFEINPVNVFGSATFFNGALFFWMSAGVQLSNTETMILYRYPSTSTLMHSRPRALVYRISSIIGIVGAHICAPALVFVNLSTLQHLWAVFSGCVLVALARTGFLVSHLPNRDHLMTGSSAFYVFGYSLQAAFCAIPNVIGPSALVRTEYIVGTTAGCCILVASMLGLWRAALLSRSSTSVMEVGNYVLFSEMLQFAASLCVICYNALYLSDGTVVTFRVLTTWGVLNQASHFLLVVHAALLLEVTKALHHTDSKWESDASVPTSMIASTPPPEWAGATLIDNIVEVMIVGGGPAGLTLANELGIRGVRTLLIDKKASVVPDSRFFLVNAVTMEGLHRLGASQRLLELGQQTSFGFGASFSSGVAHPDTEVFCKQTAPSRDEAQAQGQEMSRLAASRCCDCVWASQHVNRAMQSVQESVLLEKARSYDCVTVLFERNCVDLRVLPDGKGCLVLVETLRSEAGESKVVERSVYQCRYLAACDGPTSIIGQRLGLCFDGFVHLHSSRSVFFRSPNLLDKVLEKLCEGHQYHIVRRNFAIGYFALRNAKLGLWTFHLHGMYSGRNAGEIKTEEMGDIIREFAGPGVDIDVITDGRWRWNFAVGRTFWKGDCVFFAGDSAHQWPPFSAFGGNTAYNDACNLGWKLAAVLKGWAPKELLASYTQERRDATLRAAMAISTMTPNPGRMLLLGRLMYSPLRFIGKARWYFGNSGEHAGNHYASAGLSYGQRYDFSSIVIGGNVPSSPPEDPISTYVPKVVPGGRVLHVAFADGSDLHSQIAMDRYTLIVGSASGERVASSLQDAFAAFGAPLAVVNASAKLRDGLREGKRNAYAASLWTRTAAVLCRPDLYVAWVLEARDADSWDAAANAGAVAQKLCGVGADLVDAQAVSVTQWLTWRMVEQLKPMRVLFTKGVFVVNEPKKDPEATKASAVSPTADDGQKHLYTNNHAKEQVVAHELEMVAVKQHWIGDIEMGLVSETNEASDAKRRNVFAAWVEDDSWDEFLAEK